jgi:hypothetical protein
MHAQVQELAKREMRPTANMVKVLIAEAMFSRREEICAQRRPRRAGGCDSRRNVMNVFSADPVLLALNHHDAQERRARIEALANLIEHFEVEPTFNGDLFTGLADRLPPPFVVTAQA